MRATTGRLSVSTTGRARTLFSVSFWKLIHTSPAERASRRHSCTRHLRRRPAARAFGRGLCSASDALLLARSATLAESSIDILLWEIPLNSHFAAPARADAQPKVSIQLHRGLRAARHAAVDHE